MKKTILLYTIAFFVAALCSLLVMYTRGLFGVGNDSVTTLKEVYKVLCDAFTIPGIIFIAFGLLMLVSGMGAFDGLSYSVTLIFKRLIPSRKYDRAESFYDYKQRKKDKRGKGSANFLFIVGGVFMAAAIIFLILYYNVP